MKHTSEPWHATAPNDTIIYTDAGMPVGNTTVYIGDRERAIDNAARIVACVNACAGMDDPAAEIQRLQDCAAERLSMLNEHSAEILRLRAERDELRSALEGALPIVNAYRKLSLGDGDLAAHKIRIALTQVTP